MDCLKATGQKALEFPDTGRAIDWLKRHRKDVAIGNVIVASGFAFIVISIAGGVLILAPLAVF